VKRERQVVPFILFYMNELQKYIVIIPVIELKQNLCRFTEHKFTWISFWNDLNKLDKKVVSGTYKFFVNPNISLDSPTKLFICVIVDTNSNDEAYKIGVEKILTLVNELVWVFLTGFRIIYHEAITIPLVSIASSTIKIDNVDLIIEKGITKAVVTPYEQHKILSPFSITLRNNGFITAYGKIPQFEGNVNAQKPLIPEEKVLNLEAYLEKVRPNKPSINSELIDMMAMLYSAAVTTEDIAISYLLLWQILESFGSAKKTTNKLITHGTLKKVKCLLDEEKQYNKDIVNRVINLLGNAKEKGDVQQISKTLKENLYITQDIRDIEKKVKEFRSIRGSITHPNPSKKLGVSKLMGKYVELFEIVERLFKSLLEK